MAFSQPEIREIFTKTPFPLYKGEKMKLIPVEETIIKNNNNTLISKLLPISIIIGIITGGLSLLALMRGGK